MMARDEERIGRIRDLLNKFNFDALVCALPSNVLMLSGYWPVIGTAVAIATREGAIGVIAPEDEKDLAQTGWADELITFHPSSLDKLTTPAEALTDPLRQLAAKLNISRSRLGYESGPMTQTASYSAINLYGDSLQQAARDAIPSATLAPANSLIINLRAIKTEREIKHIRLACSIAGEAFTSASKQIILGLAETRVAALFQEKLSSVPQGTLLVRRANGFVFCMSGANSAQASKAYARSQSAKISNGECILIHCNSYCNGYWTDITRTYCMQPAREEIQKMYAAVFEARAAALQTIRPGVRGREVDEAARKVMRAHGFEKEFKHSTGHGVGFGAIDPNARPRLHPKSDDLLEAGMVFNVEPAVYIEGFGGVRHCDMVALTANGCELLTDFQSHARDLLLTTDRRKVA